MCACCRPCPSSRATPCPPCGACPGARATAPSTTPRTCCSSASPSPAATTCPKAPPPGPQHPPGAPRRPRAQLLHGHPAHGGLVGSRLFRRRFRRHQRPVGATARWRQPGSDQDAGRDQGLRSPAQPLHRQGQGPQRPLPAHGLRPPRLQDHRRPGQGDTGHRAGPGGKACPPGPPARHRLATGGGGPGRRILHFPAPLPQRGLLLRRHLPGHRFPRRDVHPPVRRRAAPRAGSPTGWR